MKPAARLCLRILLWFAGAVILGVLAMLVYMQVNMARHGDGGEMAEGIALIFGILFIAYYFIVFVLGRLMLERGGAHWGWFLVALTAILLAVPILYVLFLASIGSAVA